MFRKQKFRLLVVLAAFMLIGGYWAFRLTSASHSPVLNIYANNVESNLTVYTNSSLVISWQTLTNTGGYGCYTQGTWGYDRQLSDGYFPASGSEDRSGDTATTGTRSYTIYCVTDEGNQYAVVDVNVVSPPPPPPPPPQPPPKPAVSLIVNGQAANITLTQGAGLTLAWSSANSPTNCTASWQANPGTSGSANRTADTATTGVKTYTYSCSNAGGTESISRSVTVVAAPTSPTNPTPTPTPSPSNPTTTSGGTTTSRPRSGSSNTPPAPTFTVAPQTEPSNGLDFLNIAIAEQTYTSAKISWTTNLPAAAYIEYATDSSYSDAQKQDTPEPRADQTAALTGLLPGKKYYFRITASADGKDTKREGEFNTQGFPVTIKVVDDKNAVIPGAEVIINEQARETDSDGQAYFGLPAGSTTAAVTADNNNGQFDFIVEDKPFTDLQSAPESQSFTFTMSSVSRGLNLGKLFILMVGIFGLAGGIWFRRHRAQSDLLATGLSASQSHRSRHHRKNQAQDEDLLASLPPPPTPIQPNQPPSQTTYADNGHHIPDWQQALQQDLKKSAKPADVPKDMFETAEDQYHYDEKLKKPPHKP